MFRSVPHMGSKFLNPFTDFLPWWKYDFAPLKNYLSKFVDFPIKTRLEDGQPRLLLTSVDIQDFSSTVVFDSYEKLHDASIIKNNRLDDIGLDKMTNDGNLNLNKEDANSKNIKKGRWYSEYGNSDNRHLILYDGIGIDQVLASALGKYAMDHPHIEDFNTGTFRQLWDGGYLSNTPLRELLTAHKNYWIDLLRIEQKKKENENCSELIARTPELEVFIVNLHPLTPKDKPAEKDLVDDRENDIFFHDRTSYDEQVAYAFTDFVNMTRDLIDLARSKGLSNEVNEILNKKAKTIGRVDEYKLITNRDLFLGKPRISKVWRIDRLDTPESTFGKVTDFTPTSVRKLIRAGQFDARISINRMELIFGIEELVSDGIMSIEEGDEIIKEAREIITTEKLLYKMKKEEVLDAHNEYQKKIDSKNLPITCKEVLLNPGRDIVKLVYETNNIC